MYRTYTLHTEDKKMEAMIVKPGDTLPSSFTGTTALTPPVTHQKITTQHGDWVRLIHTRGTHDGHSIKMHSSNYTIDECLIACSKENGKDVHRSINHRCDRVVYNENTRTCTLFDSNYFSDKTIYEENSVPNFVTYHRA